MRAIAFRTSKLWTNGRALRALHRDSRGSVLVEFAVCSSAFIALLLAAVQTALVFFAQQCLQTSAEVMARRVATGQVTQKTNSQEQFRQAACSTLPHYLDCARLMVDVRQAPSFSGLDMSLPMVAYDANGKVTNNWSYSTGSTGSVVILRLMYPWWVGKGPLGFDLSNQGSGPRILIGTMVFKSEPYRT